MKHVFFALALLTGYSAGAQVSKEYPELIKQAEMAYEAKQYKESAIAYSKAFASNEGKGYTDDKYNAACSWALAGNADSAFFLLNRIATKGGYSNLPHMSTDPDLENLHKDKRWDEVSAIVKANKDKTEANLDKALVAQLDSIYTDDQSGRVESEALTKKYGFDSKEVKELWKSLNKKDSINLIKVSHILDTRGWLGPEVIGGRGNNTLFLVIQHADIKTQEKYLPMMREAVKNGKAQGSALALLEDRVALREGRKQTYGSQVGMDPKGHYYLSPLEDPDNVDKRRAEVGLQPLANYLAHWNLQWDLEAYKKQLPEIEKMEKAQPNK